MHMHVTTGDGMRQNGLIRKLGFVVQLSHNTVLDDAWPWRGYSLRVLFHIMILAYECGDIRNGEAIVHGIHGSRTWGLRIIFWDLSRAV